MRWRLGLSVGVSYVFYSTALFGREGLECLYLRFLVREQWHWLGGGRRDVEVCGLWE